MAEGGTTTLVDSIDPTRLAFVRAARLKALQEKTPSEYADLDSLREELRDARRFFVRRGWPVIDVTQRSIEQVAAMIDRHVLTVKVGRGPFLDGTGNFLHARRTGACAEYATACPDAVPQGQKAA